MVFALFVQTLHYLKPSTVVNAVLNMPHAVLSLPNEDSLQDSSEIIHFVDSSLAKSLQSFTELRSFFKSRQKFEIGQAALVSNGTSLPWLAMV